MTKLQEALDMLGWRADEYSTAEQYLLKAAGELLDYRAFGQRLLDIARQYGWSGSPDLPRWLQNQLTAADELRKMHARQADQYNALTDELRELLEENGWQPGDGSAVSWLRKQLRELSRKAEGASVQYIQAVGVNHGWPKDVALGIWLDQRLRKLASMEESAEELRTARQQLAQAQATAHGTEALRSRLGDIVDTCAAYDWQEPGEWQEPGSAVTAYLRDDSSATASAVHKSLTEWLGARLDTAERAELWESAYQRLRKRLAVIRDLALEHGMNMSADHQGALLHRVDSAMAETAMDQLRSWLAVRLKRLKYSQRQIGELQQELQEARAQLADTWTEELLDDFAVEPARTCQLCTKFSACIMRIDTALAGTRAEAHLPSLYGVLAANCTHYVDRTATGD